MREYLLVLVVAAAVTFLMTSGARLLALRTGAVARPRDRDVHTKAVPRMGGLGIYLGFAAAVGVAWHLPALQSTFSRSSEVAGVLMAGGLICLLGLVDDRLELDWFTKLAGQVAAVGVMALQGVVLALVYLPWGDLGTLVLGPELAIPLTMLIAIITINAVNFIDGLDGLAAGVVGIAATAFFLFSYWLSRVEGFEIAAPPTLITAALAGACIGFLPHNFQPARVFMGDSGSMLLGLVLAAAVVTSSGQLDPQGFTAPGLLLLLVPVLVPLVVLAVPLLDFVLAVVRRLVHGQSPFKPDKMHLHHRLLELGHSHRGAVFAMYLLSAAVALGAVLPLLFGAVGAAVLALLAFGAVATYLVRVLPRLRRNGAPVGILEGGQPDTPTTVAPGGPPGDADPGSAGGETRSRS